MLASGPTTWELGWRSNRDDEVAKLGASQQHTYLAKPTWITYRYATNDQEKNSEQLVVAWTRKIDMYRRCGLASLPTTPWLSNTNIRAYCPAKRQYLSRRWPCVPHCWLQHMKVVYKQPPPAQRSQQPDWHSRSGALLRAHSTPAKYSVKWLKTESLARNTQRRWSC